MNTAELLNKCDHCGLKQTGPPTDGKLFTDLATLYKNGIIKQCFPRKNYAGGIDNVKATGTLFISSLTLF